MNHCTFAVKNTIKSTALVAAGAIICFFIIAVLINQNQLKEYVSSANSTAKTHYNYFSQEIIELSSFTNVPEDGEYVVMGECHDFASYTAYAGDLFKQDTLLYGNKNLIANSFWAIRIENGRIVEAWSSNYPLNRSQLHAYTNNEQYEQVHIFEKFNESKIIGYYYVQ